MQKRISVKNILSALSSLILVAAIISVLILVSQGSESGGTTLENITPIDFSSERDVEGEIIAENDSFILYSDVERAEISVLNKKNGELFSSVPKGVRDNEQLKNAAKNELSSLICFTYADRDSNVSSQNSMQGSVNKGNFSAKKIKNGILFEFYFENEGFLIPVEITLTDKGMRAAVVAENIKERSDLIKLTTVSLLPNFGAGLNDDEGYVFIPDGCGSIAGFKASEHSYSARVYGLDCAVGSDTKTELCESARLPVFGIKNGSNAFCAIITQGDARARINAYGSSERLPFTGVSSEFIYRERILVNISQKTFEYTQVNMFEEKPCAVSEYAVEYRICDTPDYNGMAAAYRDYLITERKISPDAENASSLYIDLVGGVMKQQSFLGIPVNKVLPITDFKAGELLLDRLSSSGIENLTLNYLYWYKNSSQSRLTTDLKPEAALGGKGGINRFLDKAKQLKFSAYLELNLTDMMGNQIGYAAKSAAAQTVRKEPVIDYLYKMSTFRKIEAAPYKYLLSPERLLGAAEKAASAMDRYNASGYSIGTLGFKLYSDLGERAVDRSAAQKLTERAIEKLSGQASLLAPQANAYCFDKTHIITDAPLYSSSYSLSDYEIPFYSMALHGIKPIAGSDINGGSDSEVAVLKALEAGVALKYTLGTDNIGETAGTALEGLYYIDDDYWLEQAVGSYKKFDSYLTAVADKKITEHSIIASGVSKTVFENGMGVLINYNDTPFAYNGAEIPAKGYVEIGWKAN